MNERSGGGIGIGGVIVLAVIGFWLYGSVTGDDEPASEPWRNPTVADAVDAPVDNESSGQENAREQAANYLASQAFSRKGLIEQLEYEGYSKADATYAVDNITVDWFEQAALKARQYLDSQSFSRSGLLEQLLYEGFTRAQAEHGVRVAY